MRCHWHRCLPISHPRRLPGPSANPGPAFVHVLVRVLVRAAGFASPSVKNETCSDNRWGILGVVPGGRSLGESRARAMCAQRVEHIGWPHTHRAYKRRRENQGDAQWGLAQCSNQTIVIQCKGGEDVWEWECAGPTPLVRERVMPRCPMQRQSCWTWGRPQGLLLAVIAAPKRGWVGEHAAT